MALRRQFFDDQQDADILSEINMIPLIDIMLVLLIVFIITAPIMQHSVNLQLPQISNIPQEIKPQTIQISVQVDGTYLWNNDVVTLEELIIKLSAVATEVPQPALHLSADKDARYENVINILQKAQQVSLTNISFITQPLNH